MIGPLFYHISGTIQALIFLLSLLALIAQARVIRSRKLFRLNDSDNNVAGSTDVISLNLILSSFCAFFSYLLYGAALAQANYYLVLTRLPACLVTIYIVYEISADRRTPISRASLWICVASFTCALLALIIDRSVFRELRQISSNFVLICGAIMFQGQVHQIVKIVQARSTGAISFRARVLNVLKDVSTVFFGLAMGLKDGWPLIAVNGVNAVMTLLVLKSFDKYGPQASQKSRFLRPTDNQYPLPNE